MAPQKQISLLQLCMNAISLMVDTACKDITCIYGNWKNVDCKSAIHQIQQFLFCIPGRLLDILHNEYIHENISFDPRIRLDMYMHPNMKKLRLHSQYKVIGLFCDDVFWKTKLCGLKKIVYMELFSTCSDNVLDVISKYCPCLEYIYCMSPTDGASDSNSYYISDIACLYLGKCKNLKVAHFDDFIIGNQAVLESGYFKQLPSTVIIVSRVLKNLTALESFRFKNIGSIVSALPTDFDSLHLKQMYLCNPELSHVLSICKFNNLRELDIIFSSEESKAGFLLVNILTILTNSTFEVSHLKLIIPHCAIGCFFMFLSIKGSFLNKLILNVDFITVELVELIGKFCPNLNYLSLDETLKKLFTPYISSRYSDEIAFTKLETLRVSGSSWHPKGILFTTLTHAKQLRDLTVLESTTGVDEVLNEILARNPLTELNRFLVTSILKYSTILYFFHLPHMTKMHFLKRGEISAENINDLKQQIRNDNLDIKIEISE